jgi:hypothetical protein
MIFSGSEVDLASAEEDEIPMNRMMHRNQVAVLLNGPPIRVAYRCEKRKMEVLFNGMKLTLYLKLLVERQSVEFHNQSILVSKKSSTGTVERLSEGGLLNGFYGLTR